MANGYWIVRLDVTDQVKYDAYRTLNGAAFKKYGARFLVRGGSIEKKLGTARQHNVVLEFPSYEDAVACYESPEYAEAIAARDDGAELDLVIVGGYDGPQP
jgi:uncharacterized protein (DUF1330 family)